MLPVDPRRVADYIVELSNKDRCKCVSEDSGPYSIASLLLKLAHLRENLRQEFNSVRVEADSDLLSNSVDELLRRVLQTYGFLKHTREPVHSPLLCDGIRKHE